MRMKESLPTSHKARKTVIFVQATMSLLTTIVFLYYAFTVETSKKCYYSEDLDQISPIDVKDMLTDVSHNFNVVIIGFAVTTLLDFILQVLRFTEVLPKFSSLIVILQLINFLVVIGFFIALHIVRFDRAGRECSTDDSLYRNFAVYERGYLLKAYVIAAWTLFGGICIGGIAFAMYLKKKQ